MTDPIVALDGATVRYGARAALARVSVEIRRGELLALAGPNGSGKSTLLRAAAGLETVSEGSIRVDGEALAALPLDGRARRIAWMPQDEPEGDDVPVVDYVGYGRHPYRAVEGAANTGAGGPVQTALRTVEMEDAAARSVRALSGGERQRVRLARVLAQETPVLFLDEPTAHLDIGHQLTALAALARLAHAGDRAVVVALHDLNLAARFSDRIVVLSRGRVVAEGRPAEVLSPELLRTVWGVDAELKRDPRTGLPFLLPRTPSVGPVPPREPAAATRPVHVVGGGGSAQGLLTGLVDRGVAVTAGVLPLFDGDTLVAEELHVPTVVELPFAPISEESRTNLRRLLGASVAIVVAPFPVGPSNLANLTELLPVASERPVILVDHPPGAGWDFVDGRAEATWRELVDRGARVVPDAATAVSLSAELARGEPTSPSAPSRGKTLSAPPPPNGPVEGA
ncbi:MAG TPA: ABC transporter ATP-binding protein [Thermoplasmata archaeon]|nr:ABC transporter ATP-binding protein [Thermoplasmata archaeon]HUJ77552.1 ABC transporter ATP-binding protein [Thermoplasmata archaeon]